MINIDLNLKGTLAQDRAAGSRMHVLDWLDGGTFIPSINDMLRPTEFFVPQSGKRMPKGWHDTNEARLGKDCGALIDDNLNANILSWWLTNVSGANIPNWDLAAEALYYGNRPALVLAEAKAYVNEFTDGSRGHGARNLENQERITQAIEEARAALAHHADGVKISSATWYQFSNRAAFAWKLASLGIPTVLIYLGFTSDKGISTDPLRDHDHWRTVLDSTRDIFPTSLWERPLDCNGTPLWFLIRSRPCVRQSSAQRAAAAKSSKRTYRRASYFAKGDLSSRILDALRKADGRPLATAAPPAGVFMARHRSRNAT